MKNKQKKYCKECGTPLLEKEVNIYNEFTGKKIEALYCPEYEKIQKEIKQCRDEFEKKQEALYKYFLGIEIRKPAPWNIDFHRIDIFRLEMKRDAHTYEQI